MADFEVQLKRTATIPSFQDWFIGAVLELSRQFPLSSRSDTLTTLQELLYSASRAGYDPQDHVSHLLFNLVSHHCDAYLWDTFTMLPMPTKRLLSSHQLNSREIIDDEACTSALETFTRASNISLLTQAIKSRLAVPSCRSSATNADRHRRPPTPPRRQPSRDSSRSTRGKPWSFPSSFKKGCANLRTSIDLSPTDLSPSPVTILLIPDFSVPALNDSPVGARLQLYWCNWQRISTNPWVISVLRDGYYLPFSVDPLPLTSDLPLLSYSRSHPLFQEPTSQVPALLAKGAIQQTDFSLGFYSHLFLVLKQNGDWRPVIDLSALNRYLSSPHFRMETVRSVMQSLPLGAWCTSIDLKDAFLHVPIARKHHKYLRFRIGVAAFQFHALPFGLTTSPLVFTRIVKTVGAYAHSQGHNMLLYLDDWNISAPSPTLCAQWTEWVLHLTASLGLIPNLPKCDLMPSQQFVFISIAFNLNTGTAHPALHRVANFLRLLRDFLSSQAHPVMKWQCLLGHMTSLEKLTRRGHLRMRPVQFILHDQWSQSLDPLFFLCTLHQSFFQSYSGGLFQSTSPQECPSTSPCQTYACSTMPPVRAGGLTSSRTRQEASGTRSRNVCTSTFWSFWLSAWPCSTSCPLVQGQLVMVMTDNNTVVAQLCNPGGCYQGPFTATLPNCCFGPTVTTSP